MFLAHKIMSITARVANANVIQRGTNIKENASSVQLTKYLIEGQENVIVRKTFSKLKLMLA